MIELILEHGLWPIVTITCIIMFRHELSRILNELSGFVGRSKYDNSANAFMTAQVGMQNLRGEYELGDAEMHDEGAKFHKIGKNSKPSSFCEHQILVKLQKEYGVPILERRSIGVSNYYFDAVMEYLGRLYGIEICSGLGLRKWEIVFDNVQKAYDGFIPEHKNRFVFMICIANLTDDEHSRLRNIAKKHDFPTVIKIYCEEFNANP